MPSNWRDTKECILGEEIHDLFQDKLSNFLNSFALSFVIPGAHRDIHTRYLK